MKRLLWLALPLIALSVATTFTHAEDDPATSDTKSEEKKTDKEDSDAEDTAEVAEEEPAVATIGKKAPDFTLKNVDGEEVKLSDYKDKIVVLEWVNLDCPWCKAHYEKGDDLVKLQKELREDDVVWLLICSSAEGRQGNFDDETLKKRIKEVDLKNEFYLKDEDGTVGTKYDARTTPQCYVIDKDQKLRYRGALDNFRARRKNKALDEVNYVKLAVEALKADKKLEHTDTKPYG